MKPVFDISDTNQFAEPDWEIDLRQHYNLQALNHRDRIRGGGGGGGSIYNGNALITTPTKVLEFYAICGTKDQGLAFLIKK